MPRQLCKRVKGFPYCVLVVIMKRHTWMLLWMFDRHMSSSVGVWVECGWSITCQKCWITCSHWHQTHVRQYSTWMPSTPGSVSCLCYVVWSVAFLASEHKLPLQRKSASSSLSRWTHLVCQQDFMCAHFLRLVCLSLMYDVQICLL